MDKQTLILSESAPKDDTIGSTANKKNLFQIFDADNREVARGFNIITLDGRKYNAAKLFDDPTIGTLILNNGTAITHDDSFVVSVWGAGSGGAPAESLFSPTEPTINDVILSSPTKFFAEDDTRTNEQGDVAKPKYWDSTYKKDITSTEFKQDSSGDYYYELTLFVDFSELKGTSFNELGTYMHEVDGVGVKSNFFLYSRITFASLPKSSEGKESYTVLYRIYL